MRRAWKWLKDRAWIAWAIVGVTFGMWVLRRSSEPTSTALKVSRRLGELRDRHRRIQREAEELDGMYAETTLRAKEEADAYQKVIERIESEFVVLELSDEEIEERRAAALDRVRNAEGFHDFTYDPRGVDDGLERSR